MGKGRHERYWYCIKIACISIILWGYVLIWYSCGDYCVDTEEKLIEVLCFRQFFRCFLFVEDEAGNRNKRMVFRENLDLAKKVQAVLEYLVNQGSQIAFFVREGI